MWLWIKKLLKPRWIVSYDCEECVNTYCGQCGRGVAEADYFYTWKSAMRAAEEWARQGEDDDLPNVINVTTIGGHTTVVRQYIGTDNVKHDASIFASIDLRTSW